MPLFAFQIVEGYTHTKSKEGYIKRLFWFTLISEIPFILFNNASIGDFKITLNIGATFFLGVLGMYVLENIKPFHLKIPFLAIILAMSFFIPMDYGLFGVLMVLLFYICKEKKYFFAPMYVLLLICNCLLEGSLFEFPAIFSLVPILMYNGKKGRSMKYFFYAFYPIHMLIIILIKILVFS